MPLTRIVAGDQMKAVNVNQIIDALDGASGAGVPISITAVSDATNFALTVQNDEPTNSRALNVLDASGNVMIRVDAGGVTLGGPLSVPDGSITSAMIADGTIVPSDLAPGAVTSQAVGGDLNGTVGNARVVVQSGSAINWRDSSGTEHPFITFGGEQLNWASTGGSFRWVNQNNTVQLMVLDNSGNLTVSTASVGGSIFMGRSVAGALYLESSNAHGLQWRGDLGAIWCFTSDLWMDQNIVFGGTGHLYWEGSKQVYSYFNGSDVTMNMAGPWGVSAPFLSCTTLYLGGERANPFIQAAGAAIRYGAPLHSFELATGGLGPLQCSSVSASSSMSTAAIQCDHNINCSTLSFDSGSSQAGAKLAFPPTTGAKISLYDGGGVQWYGLGVNSNEFAFAVPSGANFTFHSGGMNGTIIFNILSNGDTQSNSYSSWHGVSCFSGYGALGTPATTAFAFQATNTGSSTGMANAWSTYSSEKFKSDITTMDDGVATIKQLRPVHYTHTESGLTSVGLIAEEVAEVYPQLVTYEEDEVVGLDYGKLAAPILSALLEVIDRLEAVEAKLAA